MTNLHRNNAFGGRTTRIFVILLFVTGAWGHSLFPINLGFAQFYAYRIIVVTISLLMFIRGSFLGNKSSLVKQFYFLFWLWFLWGLIGVVAFSQDFASSLNAFSNAVIGLLLIVVVLNLNLANAAGMKTLCYSWCLAFIVTGLISVWSIQTGQNLDSSWSLIARTGHGEGITASTFDNPNNYAAFLALFLPFLFLSIRLSSRFMIKLVLVIFIGVVFFLILTTASRLGLFAAIVAVGTYALIIVFYTSLRRKYIIALGITMLISVFILAFPEIPPLEIITSSLLPESTAASDNTRLNLTSTGLELMWMSSGLGIGAGNFSYYISSNRSFYLNGNLLILAPHNYWIEIGSQYGLIVLVPFVIWLIGTYRVLLQGLRIVEIRTYVFIGVIGLPTYIIASLTSSNFIPGQVNWLFLASYTSIAMLADQTLQGIRSSAISTTAPQSLIETRVLAQRNRII